MGTNFRGKIGKIGLLTFIRRLSITKRNGGTMAIIWLHRVKILVNFGPVTSEFTTIIGVHPLVDQQCG